MQWVRERNIRIMYDCESGEYTYTDSAKMWLGIEEGPQALWDFLAEKQMLDKTVAEQLREKQEEVARSNSDETVAVEVLLWERGGKETQYRVSMVCIVPGKTVQLLFVDIDAEVKSIMERAVAECGRDGLTGLLEHNTFKRRVENLLADKQDIAGQYAMFYVDILGFKAINEIFGPKAGDELLKYVGNTLRDIFADTDLLSRIGSDRFVVFAQGKRERWNDCVALILSRVSEYSLPYEITCHIGVYETEQKVLSTARMEDRALLALATVKDSYTERYAYYTEDIRKEMLTEREIAGVMAAALHEKQFVVYYQPQYSHSTGTLLGAEALVRWMHPDKGMISPAAFIPIFERNGFITKLDLYVFEETCIFLRECLDKGTPVVAISTNISRNDIYMPDFVEKLEEIRERHNIPVNLLHLEITESAVRGNGQYINEVVRKLHSYGYVVEMDDFGSGYSSLNVLKNIPLDILKLDMLFLVNDSNENRGGTILSSVVRMAKWLNMPVIAEGVENIEQADFLRSIGCDYVQGYLYSRPIPREQYEELLVQSNIGFKVPQSNWTNSLDFANFWNPKSQETLIFNDYVGGAAIFCYNRQDGSVEMLRVNQKYLQEMGMNMSEKEAIRSDFLKTFDEANVKIYIDMLERGVKTGEEQECETWRTVISSCCGAEKLCIRSTCKLIGKSGDSCLFYVRIRNITGERNQYMEILDSERRFKMASEQVNIYYWEYEVATHEMRPCFRCMRDLGLPAILTNYPDSAIEMGIFPPEVADLYRDWHRQIDAGEVEHLEGEMPLTVGRVPFRVRYTTEFDENGRPVKAYGSAALIVE